MDSYYFRKDMKTYIRHFLPLFLVAAVVLAASLLLLVKHNRDAEKYQAEEKKLPPSTNQSRVYGEQRVFDYAGQLSDTEEAKLTERIHEAERRIGYDIVIVTLNQSLADYAPEYRAGYSMRITPDKYVMVYADKFWEDNKFGYDGPQVLDGTTRTGHGIILVDNLFREPETNKIYTWMGTTGKAQEQYTSSMIDEALDVFYENVESDYYRACCDFVDKVERNSAPDTFFSTKYGYMISPLAVIAGVVILVIYIIVNLRAKAGEVTVHPNTYLVGKKADFLEHTDRFLRKSVSKTYNPPSSSSGGGGGHISGGGGSHGGGGHSR